jgi:uncharacterized membrane protein
MLERLTFFSDAVFAIAMTLLVIEVRLPHLDTRTDAALGQALLGLIPNYAGFLISFLVLARFWIGHHMMMAKLRAAPPRLVWANLFFLLAVAFMPFPTAIMSEYSGLRVGVGFYTGWLVVLGLVNHVLMRIASDKRLLADHADPAAMAMHVRSSTIPLMLGVAAFVAGMIQPLLAVAVLMVGAPLLSRLVRGRG